MVTWTQETVWQQYRRALIYATANPWKGRL
jgi:hypothetical protein